jgi:hypothetical protein
LHPALSIVAPAARPCCVRSNSVRRPASAADQGAGDQADPTRPGPWRRGGTQRSRERWVNRTTRHQQPTALPRRQPDRRRPRSCPGRALVSCRASAPSTASPACESGSRERATWNSGERTAPTTKGSLSRKPLRKYPFLCRKCCWRHHAVGRRHKAVNGKNPSHRATWRISRCGSMSRSSMGAPSCIRLVLTGLRAGGTQAVRRRQVIRCQRPAKRWTSTTMKSVISQRTLPFRTTLVGFTGSLLSAQLGLLSGSPLPPQITGEGQSRQRHRPARHAGSCRVGGYASNQTPLVAAGPAPGTTVPAGGRDRRQRPAERVDD